MELLAVLIWWGGAMKLANNPNETFWRALIWPYLLGRYLATNCIEARS